MASQRAAIFLSGPIGVGKTTLGRELARILAGRFIEGDEHAAPGRPWYASSLSTSRSILREITVQATRDGPAVVSYPLRCVEWIFFSRRLADVGIKLVVVSLTARFDAIIGASRKRSFSAYERHRIREMIDQGYGNRAFSDIFIRTDEEDPITTVKALQHYLAQRGFLN